MLFGQLLLLHMLVGVSVAAALYLVQRAGPTHGGWFPMAAALLFWPLYLPLLLSARADAGPPDQGQPPAPPADDLALAIGEVDRELEAALRGLDGWAGGVVLRERQRLDELRRAWALQAQRIREMDRVLAAGRGHDPRSILGTSPNDGDYSGRLRESADAIEKNRLRLRQVRDRALADLLGTLAWVRELVSQIHLAKFTGQPAARAEELVAQIAAAVDGLAAVAIGDADADHPL